MFPRPFVLFVLALAGHGPLAATEHPLVLDPANSRIEVAVKATLHGFTGLLSRYDAAVALDDQGAVCSARVRFDFRTLNTGKPDRDRAMWAWEEAETFPNGEFALTSLRSVPAGGFEATGKFTFHGVTRELRFPVTITHDGPVYAIDGEVPLDTRDYSLPIIRMIGLLKVDPIVRVRFHLQGRRSS